MKILILVLALLGITQSLDAQKAKHHRKGSPKQRTCGVVKPVADRVSVYNSGELSGRQLGDLYAAYIGSTTITDKVSLDPARQLDSLWAVKVACYPGNPLLSKLRKEFVASYKKERRPKSLGEFVQSADVLIRTAKADVDWNRFAELYRLSSVEVSVVRKLSDRLTGRDFVAYGLTELMPTDQGLLNMQVLEFIVRNSTPEFLYRIPAIHDKYASFGFFQFTSLAVNGKTLEGASRASLALKRNPLPGSVADVQGELQFRAAYLFAIHNIARMVGNLNKKELSTLNGLGSKNHDDLIQFIAASHNGPAHAQSAAAMWLDNRMRADYFVSVRNASVRRYAFKTKMNLAALRTHKDLSNILYGSR